MYPKIETLCKEFEQEFDLIPANRKEKLGRLREYILQKIEENEIPKLVVICTHNSRRSHIGQICLALGADYFQGPKIQTYSGGTEATAFNIRAVNAFQKLGLKIEVLEGNENNPIYAISWKKGMEPYRAFSKKYEDAPNPKEAFAAILVCSEADEACPHIAASDFRLSLPYDDPKEYDGTDLEPKKYEEKIKQIGREMFFVLSQLNNIA